MPWDLIVSRAAERTLRTMPRKDLERINKALNAMKQNPFAGSDVSALKGELQGWFRQRVGSWRIVFRPDPERRIIRIADIRRRTSTTY